MTILAPLAPLETLLAEETSVKRAMCIATTVKRADTLKADGYDFVRTDRTGVYLCQKPPKVNKKTGEITEEYEPYIVDVQAQTCTCIQFERCGVCKHERACRQAVSEALELLLPPSGNPMKTPKPLTMTVTARCSEHRTVTAPSELPTDREAILAAVAPLLPALEALAQAVEMAMTCGGTSHITDTLSRKDIRQAYKNAMAHIEAARGATL